MHLYIILRGIKHDVDRFISELSAKYLPFKYHGEDKVVQVAVRPIQLYEIVFPKEHLNSMIYTLWQDKKANIEGQPSVGFMKKYARWFRRLLHLEEIPKDISGGLLIPFYRENIEVIGLGMKADRDLDDGTEGL